MVEKCHYVPSHAATPIHTYTHTAIAYTYPIVFVHSIEILIYLHVMQNIIFIVSKWAYCLRSFEFNACHPLQLVASQGSGLCWYGSFIS